jgi:hypothetical protein
MKIRTSKWPLQVLQNAEISLRLEPGPIVRPWMDLRYHLRAPARPGSFVGATKDTKYA